MNDFYAWFLGAVIGGAGTFIAGLMTGLQRGRRLARFAAKEEQNWKTLCLEEKRKREEIFEALTQIGKERDTWQAWFQKCGLEHSVAQAALISECERLSRKAGDKIRLRDGIKAATLAFEAKYGPAGYPKIVERIRAGEGPDDVHRE